MVVVVAVVLLLLLFLLIVPIQYIGCVIVVNTFLVSVHARLCLACSLLMSPLGLFKKLVLAAQKNTCTHRFKAHSPRSALGKGNFYGYMSLGELAQ